MVSSGPPHPVAVIAARPSTAPAIRAFTRSKLAGRFQAQLSERSASPAREGAAEREQATRPAVHPQAPLEESAAGIESPLGDPDPVAPARLERDVGLGGLAGL